MLHLKKNILYETRNAPTEIFNEQHVAKFCGGKLDNDEINFPVHKRKSFGLVH